MKNYTKRFAAGFLACCMLAFSSPVFAAQQPLVGSVVEQSEPGQAPPVSEGGGQVVAPPASAASQDAPATSSSAETPKSSSASVPASANSLPSEGDTLPESALSASEQAAIAAFAPLEEAVATQVVALGTAQDSLTLPQTLQAEDTSGNTVEVAVSMWESAPAYTPETEGDYLFTPVLAEETPVDGQAEAPVITVRVQGRSARVIGVGTAQNPFVISTPAMLAELAEMVNAGDSFAGKYFKLENDIDLSQYAANTAFNNGEGWIPIGTYIDGDNDAPFQGNFDGAGHKITGLSINSTATASVGLFGYAQNAAIANVGVELAAAGIVAKNSGSNLYVGGLVGRLDEGQVTGSYTTGGINNHGGTIWTYTGGLVGRMAGGQITGSYATGAIQGDGYTGGLVGIIINGQITDSYATSAVSGNSSSHTYTGGLVGNMSGGQITGSYATGAVSGSGTTAVYTGGLVGRIDKGQITDSYATGAVSGTGSSNAYTGGLVGHIDKGQITDSYATGAVSGTGSSNAYTGGLVGWMYGGQVTGSYATGAVSGNGRDTYTGGLVGNMMNGEQVTGNYATGAVSGNGSGNAYTGGLVGYMRSGAPPLQNNIALNPSVTGGTNGRIAGIKVGGTLTANLAFNGIKNNDDSTNWANVGADNMDGASITAADIWSGDAFPDSFKTAPWVWEAGKLPTLANIAGQSGEIPAHIKRPAFAGEGTQASPFRLVTPEDMAKLATLVNGGQNFAGQYFKLENDIDLSAYAAGTTFNNGEGWIPIGTYIDGDNNAPFQGNFDGAGYKITGLSINSTATAYVGLFGYAKNATIENVGVELAGAGIVAQNSGSGLVVGGLVGWMDGGQIAGSYATGTVSSNGGTYTYTGGLVGQMAGGQITSSYATCAVIGNGGNMISTGGLLGEMIGGQITGNYATGGVSGNGRSGGLVGNAIGVSGTMFIQNNVTLNPSVAGNGNGNGRIAGKKVGATLTANLAFDGIKNNDSSTNWANVGADNMDGASITAADIWSGDAFPDSFKTAPWAWEPGKLPTLANIAGQSGEIPAHIKTGDFAGEGTHASPFRLATPEDMAKLATLVNGGQSFAGQYFKLENDIDLSQYAAGTAFNNGEGWIPIGTYIDEDNNAPFQGNFGGAGYKITGLSINSTATVAVGLFGYAQNAAIANVGVELAGAGIVAENSGSDLYVGGLVGRLDEGQVTGSYTTGGINNHGGTIWAYTGGLVGQMEYGQITGSYTTVGINNHGDTTWAYTGGLVGQMEYGQITGSYTTGGINNHGDTTWAYTGGLVGQMEEGQIRNSYATGAVSGNGSSYTYTGGLVGNMSGGQITGSYATGAVSGSGTTLVSTGGLVGQIDKGQITDSYATGAVSGNGSSYTYTGGLVGNMSGGQITGSYATGAVSGSGTTLVSTGGLVGQGHGAPLLQNNIALNPSVTGGTNGRIAGKVGGTRTANLAFDGIKNNDSSTNWANVGADNMDGANITAADVWSGDAFPDSFKTAPWTWEPGKLPTLANIAGQSGEIPAHIKRPAFAGEGTQASPFRLVTPEDMAKLATLVNGGQNFAGKYFKLENDIDLSQYATGTTFNNGEGWIPIGTYIDIDNNAPFSGNFDGAGHKITGLSSNSTATKYVGLFGAVTNATIENVGVELAADGIQQRVQTTNSSAGGVVGYANTARIANCSIRGVITSDKGDAGGIVGMADSYSQITNCSAMGSVTGAWSAGGVAGSLYNHSSLAQCYATSAVFAASNGGGVVGNVDNESNIDSCYATGDVNGAQSGGVAGSIQAGSTVSNCYATGAVSGEFTGRDANGGVAGFIGVECVLKNSAALNSRLMDGKPSREVGETHESAVLQNNYVFDGKQNSTSISALQAVTPDFWVNEAGWSQDIWVLEKGKLPILKGLAGQNGEPGFYLTGFPEETGRLTITPKTQTMLESKQQRTVNIAVTGWENWTHGDITFETSAGTLAAETPAENGKAALTIPANYTGEIIVTATNPNSGVSATATITVNAASLALDELAAETIPAGKAYEKTATALYNGEETLRFSASSLPNGLTITPEGKISGVPAVGTHTITVTVTAGTKTDSKSYVLTVQQLPESGSTKPESGSTKPESGSTKPESGSTKPESGSTKPESGSTKPESGSTKPQSETPAASSGLPTSNAPAPSGNTGGNAASSSKTGVTASSSRQAVTSGSAAASSAVQVSSSAASAGSSSRSTAKSAPAGVPTVEQFTKQPPALKVGDRFTLAAAKDSLAWDETKLSGVFDEASGSYTFTLLQEGTSEIIHTDENGKQTIMSVTIAPTETPLAKPTTSFPWGTIIAIVVLGGGALVAALLLIQRRKKS